MRIISALLGDPLFPWLVAALSLALLGWSLYFSKKPPKVQSDESGKLYEAMRDLHAAILFGEWGTITEQEFCTWLQQLPEQPQPSVGQMEQAAIEEQARSIEHAMQCRHWEAGTFTQFLLRIKNMSAEEIIAFLAQRR